MKINLIELVNVLIVVILLFVVARRRDPIALLIVIFIYGTLHFCFGAFALAMHESTSVLVEMHNEGGGGLAKFSALTLLGVSFALLGKYAYYNFIAQKERERKAVRGVLFTMAAILLGYILNNRQGDWLQLKNVVSIEIYFIFLLMGVYGFFGAPKVDLKGLYAWGMVGLVLLVAMDCIAFYEVFTGSSWAGTPNSTGTMVYRASSVLFNPNLYAFWGSLVFIGCGYGFHNCEVHRKLIAWGMILAALGIYLSGARSVVYLLLAVLLVPSLLIKEKRRWGPILFLTITFLVIYVGAIIGASLSHGNSDGWSSIALLGERFAAAPRYLLVYVLQLGNVPPEITMSIEGRFVGEGRDAGWFVLYEDIGWIGLFAIVLASCKLAVWAVREHFLNPGPSSAYALSMLCFCLLTGFVMRFQIFPVWLFVGIALTLCIVFWRLTTRPTTGEDKCVLSS